MTCIVILELAAKPGTGDDLLGLLDSELPETRNKEGCEEVRVTREQDAPDTFVLVMRWTTRGHYERYFEWRRAQGTISRLGDALVAPPTPRFFDPLDV